MLGSEAASSRPELVSPSPSARRLCARPLARAAPETGRSLAYDNPARARAVLLAEHEQLLAVAFGEPPPDVVGGERHPDRADTASEGTREQRHAPIMTAQRDSRGAGSPDLPQRSAAAPEG